MSASSYALSVHLFISLIFCDEQMIAPPNKSI